MAKIFFIACLFWLSGLLCVQAQQPPFFNEVAAFKKQDSISFPQKGSILFVGSSSFRMWDSIANYFPGFTIINRGFGGSSLTDMIRYVDDLITPYQPKQIVIYCGENDLAASDTVGALHVLDRFRKLFRIIREKIPFAHILYVSIKPSPIRAHLLSKVKQSNKAIKAFLTQHKNVAFADVFMHMTDQEDKIREDIFLPDRLHLNTTGYKIWQAAITPYLLNE